MLENMSTNMLKFLIREGMKDFTIPEDDFAYSLIIDGIAFNGEFSSTEPIEISIPKLSEYCDYSIIGIYDATYSCTNRTPLSIVLPEGVEFIYTIAFMSCKFVAEISFPSTLKFIGGFAFYNCENLESVIFNCDNIYIGKDAFGNTSVEIAP